MADDHDERKVRLRLRRPEVVEKIAELAAIPREFDPLFPKAYYAYQLRLAGYDWHRVANKLNYRSAWAAENAVRKWLYRANETKTQARRWAVTREQMHADAVTSECDRLDALQAAYWEDAVGGDIASANFCLRVIAQRSRLQGLEAASTQVTQQLNTLVVGGTENEYVAALLKARDALAPPGPTVIEGADDAPRVVD